jgi:hypothetical protein
VQWNAAKGIDLPWILQATAFLLSEANTFSGSLDRSNEQP